MEYQMLTTHKIGSNVYDDSLTNLSWLHDINIVKRTIPTINNQQNSNSNNDSNEFIDDEDENDVDRGTNSTMNNNNNNDFNIYNDEQWRFYRNNPQAKPVYSYSQLILLAMKQSGHEKMTLQMIYDWVADNFPYFKKMEPTWQNSIRHNLSLNKWFIKVARTRKETSGKGGFWKLSPDYERHYRQINSSIKPTPTITKRTRPNKRQSSNISRPNSFVRLSTGLLSPMSSPETTLPITPSSTNSQTTHDFRSILSPSPSISPSSTNKLEESDLLLLDPATFDWDAYLDVQSFMSSKVEQDLFNEFNAALTDLTTSATNTDVHAFDGFDYPMKSSTYNTLFNDEIVESQSNSLSVKGHGIKRPSWWITNETTKLPSLETAFDLKLSK